MVQKLKIIWMLLLLGIFSLSAQAFTLNVNCPSSANAGDTVTCSVVLNEQITSPEVFGEQFVIDAPGFTAGNPFLESSTNGVQATHNGSLNGVVLLLKYTEGQNAGSVATFYLVAGNTPGSYTISLSNYILATGINSDSIEIISSSTSSSSSSGGSGGGSGGGGGGGGSGSSAVSTVLEKSSAEGLVNTKVTGGNLNPELTNDQLSEGIDTQAELDGEASSLSSSTKDAGKQVVVESEKKISGVIILLIGIFLMVIIIVTLLLRYIHLNKMQGLN